MKNQSVATFKNLIVVAFIIVGAIIIAIPIFIFGLFRLAWVNAAISLAGVRQNVPREKIRHLLEAVETHIGPQTPRRGEKSELE